MQLSFLAEETSLSEEALEDAAVKGAVMMMSNSMQCWRGMFRIPDKLARTIYATMGCRKNTSSDLQYFITFWIWKFLRRFVSPPCIQLGKPI